AEPAPRAVEARFSADRRPAEPEDQSTGSGHADHQSVEEGLAAAPQRTARPGVRCDDPAGRLRLVCPRRLDLQREGWSYQNTGDKVPQQAGIRHIMLRQRGAFANQFRLVVTGRGGNLQAAAGQTGLDLTVVIDSPIATTGQCAEALFVTQGTG